MHSSSKKLIDKKTLLAMIPLCERTIYNFEKKGKFPGQEWQSERWGSGLRQGRHRVLTQTLQTAS